MTVSGPLPLLLLLYDVNKIFVQGREDAEGQSGKKITLKKTEEIDRLTFMFPFVVAASTSCFHAA